MIFQKKILRSQALSILSYCIVSILVSFLFMTIINKYVAMEYGFNLNFFILIIQLLISIIILQICKFYKVIHLSEFNISAIKQWFPMSFSLVIVIYLHFKAYGEVFFMGGTVSIVTLLSFFMMVLSSLIIAWEDLYFLLSSLFVLKPFSKENYIFLHYGYIWMLMNCFCSSVYILGTRKKMKLKRFTDFDAMFYNDLLGIPLLIICTLTIDDWSNENIARNMHGKKIISMISILLSGILSSGISYTSLWCIRVTSSTTYSMVGALNKLPISIFGLLFFKTPATFSTISAIILGFLSGILYTIEKCKLFIQNACLCHIYSQKSDKNIFATY
ncbi:hypothetical protein PORY_000453 [Pneumocystis oryctolagi]|uniref:Uncharacterized protein n=1 Tax=Pneumocystis oryctolagi TaxID=42067 RepID=A0ACB7CG98_9ASCO|nr:hypothetical protein PORY_000453 [Pneumocystis oryctolagi]